MTDDQEKVPTEVIINHAADLLQYSREQLLANLSDLSGMGVSDTAVTGEVIRLVGEAVTLLEKATLTYLQNANPED